ncbi:MAG: acyl-CoA dehydrogenase family protein, partial [Vicinamibacteria bacterium]
MTDDFLDWPFFEERHRALRTTLRHWIRNHLADIDESDERKACKILVERLGQGGFLDHAVPKPGGALDLRSLCVIRETLAHHHGLADFAFAMQGLGSAPITLVGSEELKERYLPKTREGSFIAAFALSEPEAGSDVGAIATTAKRDGDDFVLDGTKTWISNGGLASYYVVFARSETAPGTKGLSAFVVDSDLPGFRVAEEIEVIAPHPLARLRFEGCRVPRSRLVG